MKTKYLLLLIFASTSMIVKAQDKNAEAIVHYTKAEDFYNQGTFLGAENCIEELAEAEDILGSTNSKILFLKIMAASKFHENYYAYNNIIWLKTFFKITDVKTFPADKYAAIINSKYSYLSGLVKDTEFEIKIKSDSAFIKEFFEYSPFYKSTADAYYKHGDVFNNESYMASHRNDNNMWRDPGYEKAYEYFYLAAEKGSKKAMSELSSMYLRGQGVLADEKKSLEYALKANDTLQLALLYCSHGEKVINDGNKVIEWCTGVFTNSTDSLETQWSAQAIAKIYEKGLGGVPKDNYKAMEWYIKANNKGADCKFNMDKIVLIGLSNDDKKTQKAVRELYHSWIKSK